MPMPLHNMVFDPMDAIDYDYFMKYMREATYTTHHPQPKTTTDMLREKDNTIVDLNEQLAELEDLYDKALKEVDRLNIQLQKQKGRR